MACTSDVPNVGAINRSIEALKNGVGLDLDMTESRDKGRALKYGKLKESQEVYSQTYAKKKEKALPNIGLNIGGFAIIGGFGGFAILKWITYLGGYATQRPFDYLQVVEYGQPFDLLVEGSEQHFFQES
ncbi:unnamed protein product [Symbiodinium sp. KB8]|nr:unnamed protein product [Symbiodinium sp. KB8]